MCDKKCLKNSEQRYLYIEWHKGDEAVILYDLCQLFIQVVEFFKEGVCSQVIEKIGQVHDLCVEVEVEGCTRTQTGESVTLAHEPTGGSVCFD